MRSVFDRTADVLSGPAHAKGLELVVACHPDVPRHLRGDPGRLRQVLANLGSNAVKFTESGEVSIRARVEDANAEHVLLRVDVADTGIGVHPDLRPVLFDAFTQADPSTTREHGGTGLGLAISRQLVTALGGNIEVASEPGAGQRSFSFTAQFAHATGLPSEPLPPADPELLRGRRVLVVDDNATNRLILDEELSAWNMLPTTVATVAEAMAALQEAGERGAPYDVAVLDLVLSDGDGLSLARAITAATPGSPPRLLLLSSGQVDAAAAHAAGIAVSLSKPVRQSELVEGLVTAATSEVPAELEVTPPATADPGGQRILVVEDNEVNQMVAVGLLESAGYAADVVGDGVQAVTALAGDHGYAAVLMDCRMPRLDGFDATRRIRSEETAGTRVPIIAMTASALEGEQQRCAEAGMDDFLTKPVDAGRMVRVLRRWAGGDASAAVPLVPEPVTAVVDRTRMRMLDGLHRDGKSLFQRAAVSFEANALGNLADLRSAVADLDGDALAAHAHRLRGSATNVGLPALGQAAGELEDLGRDGRLEDAAAALGRLATALDHALTALAEIREAGP